jgi:hypothetical protein
LSDNLVYGRVIAHIWGHVSPDLHHRNQLSHAQQIVCSGTRRNIHSTRCLPRILTCLTARSCLAQPKTFSTSLRLLWLMAKPGLLVRLRQPVWPRRIRSYSATCGTTLRAQSPSNELLLLVAFVGANRAGLATFESIQQHQRRLSLPRLSRLGHHRADINPFRFSVTRWPK